MISAQVLLVEERELQGPARDQGLNRRGAQGGDPLEPLNRPDILAQAGVGDHAPIADQHHARDPKPLADLRDLRR